jgi:hypothetical protein
MGEDKISVFYSDPFKRACDAHSVRQARYLRAISSDPALPWRLRRFGRSVGHLGAMAVRQTRELLSTGH